MRKLLNKPTSDGEDTHKKTTPAGSSHAQLQTHKNALVKMDRTFHLNFNHFPNTKRIAHGGRLRADDTKLILKSSIE